MMMIDVSRGEGMEKTPVFQRTLFLIDPLSFKRAFTVIRAQRNAQISSEESKATKAGTNKTGRERERQK
jgi:hypothetical protein|tara:strand:+ start:334 stop:540 length:207 start_codon:yes stop_codon:yes gene_type:complete